MPHVLQLLLDQAAPTDRSEHQPAAQQLRIGAAGSDVSAWKRYFLEHHDTNHWYKRDLFRVCHGGRDWVVGESPVFTVNLDTDPEQLQSELPAVRKLLRLRGQQPVKLGLCHQGDDTAPLVAAVAALQDDASSIQELETDFPDIPAAVLAAVGTALPAVRKLELYHEPGGLLTLPQDTTSFPKLRHLDLYVLHSAEHLYDSVQPYAAQLTQISFWSDVAECTPGILARLLGSQAGTQWTTLRQLDTSLELTDEHLEIVMQCVPGLKQLRVQTTALQSDHSSRTWQLEALAGSPEETWLLSQIALMPQPPAGKQTAIVELESLDIHSPSSEAEARHWSNRLNDFTFPAEMGWVITDEQPQTSPSMQGSPATPTTAGAALTILLSAITALGTRSRTLAFQDYTLTQGFINILSTAKAQGWRGIDATCLWSHTAALPGPLPAIDTLNLHWRTIGDSQMQQLLTQTASVSYLIIEAVDLKSDQFSGAAWPWDTLRVGAFNFQQLPLLPDPSHPSSMRKSAQLVIGKGLLSVTSAKDMEELHSRIDPRLSSLEVAMSGMSLTLAAAPTLREPEQPAALRAALQLVRTVLSSCRYADVTLSGWTMSEGVMQQLSELADWGGGVIFQNAVWLSEKGVYQALPGCIPAGFTRWEFTSGCPDTVRVVEEVCASIPPHSRTQKQYLMVRARIDQASGVLQRIHDRWQAVPGYEHVSLLTT